MNPITGVLAALAALVPFVRGFSTTNVFFVRDLGLFFWPRHLWLWQTLRERDWPLWVALQRESAAATPSLEGTNVLSPERSSRWSKSSIASSTARTRYRVFRL